MQGKRKAKYKAGQVVRVHKRYFRITKVQYSADRCAPWDNGWWYWEGSSVYSENCVRPLSLKEMNLPNYAWRVVRVIKRKERGDGK